MSAIDPLSANQNPVSTAIMRPDAAISALGLKVGQEVQAKVTALISQTLAQLALPGGVAIEAEMPRALPLGATLTFTVQRDGASGMMLATTEKALAQAMAGAAHTTPQQARGDTAMPRQGFGSDQLVLAQGQTRTAQNTQTLSQPQQAAATAQQVVAAAPRLVLEQVKTLQNPVLQSQVLAQSQNNPQTQPTAYLPPGAAQMIAKLAALAAALPADEHNTGQLPQHDDKPMGGRSPLAQTPLNLLQQSPPKALKEVLALAIRQAAPQQDSLAPLFANLTAITTPASGLATLPKPVMDAAAALLGLRFNPDSGPLAQNLAKAVAGSGVFMESHLAHGQTATAQTDIKAALLALKSALGDGKSPQATQQQAPQTPPTALHERPPLRQAMPLGQPPAASTLTADMPREAIIATLARQTDAGLSRLTLTQAASLPENRDNLSPVQTQNHVTVLEVPIRLGQETAIAQMRIEREEDDEPESADKGPAQPAFTMRFSLEASPMGPVHAAVRMKSGHVGINIWAEDPETFARFQHHLSELNDALEGSSFQVEALNCALGKPAEIEAKPNFRPAFGQLLDRSS